MDVFVNNPSHRVQEMKASHTISQNHNEALDNRFGSLDAFGGASEANWWKQSGVFISAICKLGKESTAVSHLICRYDA